MKKVLLFLLVGLLPVGLFAQQGDNNQQKTLVFTHATVIDATGAPAKPDMTVVVRGDRIEALGETGKLTVPQNMQVVNATGKFLIPGLWDMHTHPSLGKDSLALFIANGVIGLRVMGGRPMYHKWRKEISAGNLIGPRMVIASPPANGPRPGQDDLSGISNEDEGRQFVRKVKKEGTDFVKVMDWLPRDAYFAIADEAKKQGIPFAGHVPFSVSAAEASDAGQQSIEHGHGVLPACSSREEEYRKNRMEGPTMRAPLNLADLTYNERKAAACFARLIKNSTWVCPTVIVWSELSFRDGEDLANAPRLEYMPLSIRDRWKNYARVFLATAENQANFKKLCQKKIEIVGAMKRSGVELLAGTDTAVVIPYCFPGFGLHDELALFVQAGLSPMEALQTATYNPAKFFGKLDSMGTIEQGKIADLVLLEANPLQDISNTQKIAAVVFGGNIFDKTALQKMLAQVKASHLHYAAADGNIEHVKLLIAEGADINARDQQRWTPALAALYAWKLAVTDLLLEKGADTAAPHLAAYTGDLRGIKRLLEKNTPVDSLKGLTLLHAAAAGGHTDVVEFLIAKGFEATATTEDDKTPLHYAALGNHQKVAEILMANGAPVDSGKGTPLSAAAWAGHKDMVEFLISKGADINKGPETPLHQAVSYWWEPDMAKLLLEAGADINARDEQGNTPLHRAVDAWRWEMTKLFVSKGAYVSTKNRRGESPLSTAKAKGRKELVEFLRKHGAKE